MNQGHRQKGSSGKGLKSTQKVVSATILKKKGDQPSFKMRKPQNETEKEIELDHLSFL